MASVEDDGELAVALRQQDRRMGLMDGGGPVDLVVSSDTFWDTGNYVYKDLSIVNGAVLSVGGGSTVTVQGSLVISGNSTLLCRVAFGGGWFAGVTG
ncbi:MAG: hypothetical protein QHJ82_12200 [Verrucomicrobiota bacterium]|nr:hypothetical protein [Verrucomicrobiota bacterium]